MIGETDEHMLIFFPGLIFLSNLQEIRDKLLHHISEKLERPRKHLTRQKQRPHQIKLLEPKIEEKYVHMYFKSSTFCL